MFIGQAQRIAHGSGQQFGIARRAGIDRADGVNDVPRLEAIPLR